VQFSRKWQKIIVVLFVTLTIFVLTSFPWKILLGITPNLTLLEGEEYLIDWNSPFNLHIQGSKEGILQVNEKEICLKGNSLNGPLSFKAMQLGNVTLDFKLFGIIPLRQMQVNVLPEKQLMPGGHSIGIKLKAEGVMVVGYNLVESHDQLISPAREEGIKIGDVIVEINHEPVSDLVRAADLIRIGSREGNPIHLKIARGEEILEYHVTPLYCQENRSNKIGLYIRDSAAGVGTMTFYESNSGIYGALGHVITDVDTNKPIDIKEGQIVRADIVNIRSARRGYPGEKNGVFVEDKDIIGSIEKNTNTGIFGRLDHIDNHPLYSQPLPIGLAQDVQIGPATILTVVEGDKIEEFSIEIQKVYQQGNRGHKDMVIKITDERLLALSGGIVQGMSGSPIIQDNKIIGAVTHVFVNEPAKGYGIFLEWMLLDSGLLEVFDDL
jgi:stage IV sporulation protein B